MGDRDIKRSDLCRCDHARSKHTKSGLCMACGCEQFTTEKAPPTLTACLVDTINTLSLLESMAHRLIVEMIGRVTDKEDIPVLGELEIDLCRVSAAYRGRLLVAAVVANKLEPLGPEVMAAGREGRLAFEDSSRIYTDAFQATMKKLGITFKIVSPSVGEYYHDGARFAVVEGPVPSSGGGAPLKGGQS